MSVVSSNIAAEVYKVVAEGKLTYLDVAEPLG